MARAMRVWSKPAERQSLKSERTVDLVEE